MNLEPIGYVNSPVKEPVDEQWGKVVARIRMNDSVAAGLHGLDQFSHVIVVYFMHRYTFDAQAHLIRRPQERADMPGVGIFAQRAKHRPNPLGVSAVELIQVLSDSLVVKGLDAIDGTPVLDIKPYVPAFDCRPAAIVPEWIERLMENYF